MSLLSKVNADLKNIDERLFISYENDDIHGQDFEEYGIGDIDETKHYAFHLDDGYGSVILKKHFGFDEPRSLYFGENSVRYLENEGFTGRDIKKIEGVLLSYAGK